MIEQISPDDRILIGQGEIEDKQWRALTELAAGMGGLLLEPTIELSEAKKALAYVSQRDFLDYTERQRIITSRGVKAFNGLMSIYHSQVSGNRLVAGFPHLRLFPEPEAHLSLRDLKINSGQYRIDFRSLQNLVKGLEEGLEASGSVHGRRRFIEQVLPPYVGEDQFRLAQGFVKAQLDTSQE